MAKRKGTTDGQLPLVAGIAARRFNFDSRPTAQVAMQLCSRCKVSKWATEFYADTSKRNGLASRCRQCTREVSKARCNGPMRDKIKAQMREYNRTHRAEIREHQKEMRRRVIATLGGECACCGEARFYFLAVDHINDDGAVDRGGSELVKTIWRHIRKQGAAPGQYRILCHNCNMGRYFNGGRCPHEEEREQSA